MSDRIPHLGGLVKELLKLTYEVTWVEFKHNNEKPDLIGEYVSAIANSATIEGKSKGYIVWGVADQTHSLVGTKFEPAKAKVGNESLETWIHRKLKPSLDFRFDALELEGTRLVILEIDRAEKHPVAFDGAEYIRVGESKRRLKDFPEKEKSLWKALNRITFECNHSLSLATF